MPARDFYHNNAKNALTKDGWTITHDPLRIQWGSKDMYVDLGAEQILAAEKGETKIAVEIKSFLGKSEVFELEHALGQFIFYHDLMEQTHPGRTLYMAITNETMQAIFQEPIGKILLENKRVRLIVFDPKSEVILQWIP